nr:MAG TPA: hypothetical protein [Caudoviricetes sp.]
MLVTEQNYKSSEIRIPLARVKVNNNIESRGFYYV